MNKDELIIELPHLQSFSQRMGSWLVSMTCWLLWIYFLIPLISLSGWLLGFRKFSSEVRWFGGYKSLIELLEIYGLTILSILFVWLLWTAVRVVFPRKRTRSGGIQTEQDPSKQLMTDPSGLTKLRHLSALTLHFDKNGVIVKVNPLNSREEPS